MDMVMLGERGYIFHSPWTTSWARKHINENYQKCNFAWEGHIFYTPWTMSWAKKHINLMCGLMCGFMLEQPFDVH